MRTYRVKLTSPTVGTLSWQGLAEWYDDATIRAEKWAEEHPDHSKYSPWIGSHAEVSA